MTTIRFSCAQLMIGQKLQRTEGAPAQFAGAKTTFTHKVHIIHADEVSLVAFTI